MKSCGFIQHSTTYKHKPLINASINTCVIQQTKRVLWLVTWVNNFYQYYPSLFETRCSIFHQCLWGPGHLNNAWSNLHDCGSPGKGHEEASLPEQVDSSASTSSEACRGTSEPTELSRSVHTAINKVNTIAGTVPPRQSLWQLFIYKCY